MVGPLMIRCTEQYIHTCVFPWKMCKWTFFEFRIKFSNWIACVQTKEARRERKENNARWPMDLSIAFMSFLLLSLNHFGWCFNFHLSICLTKATTLIIFYINNFYIMHRPTFKNCRFQSCNRTNKENTFKNLHKNLLSYDSNRLFANESKLLPFRKNCFGKRRKEAGRTAINWLILNRIVS